ncbi:hypothetical protein PIB30_096353, partial [Stylosanthes scabra]|nr:hypothetical protein [Stylosanthes scabra]
RSGRKMEEIPINDEGAGESSNLADPGKRSRPEIEKFHSLGTLQANRWRMYKILIFKKEPAKVTKHEKQS